jgi:hypothetical protein
LRDNVLDYLAGLIDACARLRGENNLFSTLGNVYDLLEGELLTAERYHCRFPIANCQLAPVRRSTLPLN